ncbi:magnesium-protoporphyrin IX monomethyl ester cyclase [Geomonas limicola]|uniref:Magnesium-protoporphyrin IX monomethyl ester cyclase n=1 Tax=Geomonas limicola TaxID=2740186 RepID=A0A6V8NHR8_9BACT|nr:radical SAM protein [Geomonas limicola]GFO70469.1 magnesium-protoporphyrin IX monomethyl ester cyclase [Geomonas limicola]
MSSLSKKVLLVTPPYHYGLTDVLGRWIPLNLVYLAGAARQAGAQPEIYDAQVLNHGFPEIEAHLAAAAPELVAVGAVTATANDALRILELAKKINPATLTVLGGVHASFKYREILENSPAVDFVVLGEGEGTFRELLETLSQGGDPATVAGLALRQGDSVVVSPGRAPETDLDRLPAAWDLLDWDNYRYQVLPDSRFGSLSSSRGCAHDCSFCSQQTFWGHSWRGRNPEAVVDEIALLHERYGVDLLQLTDEHPTRDAERWERLLDLLIERALPVRLILETRVSDLIRDRDIVAKYKQAGVIHVSIGVESLEQARLDQVHKGQQVEEAQQAVELLREHGIVSEISLVLGFPDDTAQSVAHGLKFAQLLNPDAANFLPLTPWPGTPLYQELKELIRESDLARFNLIDPVLEPHQLTLAQLDLALTDCFRKFYMGKMFEVMTMKDEFRRGYMVRATKLIMASPFVMKKFGMLVKAMMPGKLGGKK